MAILSSFSGCTKDDGDNHEKKRYVTEQSFDENLERQTAMSRQTIEQLRKYGVSDSTVLRLEFFFYTNAEEKAYALAGALKKLNYEVKLGRSAGDSLLILITGWTVPLKMDERSVEAWTEQMARLGYKHDCEFDGWGTTPEQ